ncbi:MAG TPA: pantetheine-phosphate adenylyltransferase [Spirochaetota bacterium]|nr:pantetheine-phosphate adenylyltransferase [Spirochaetota bacterium]HPI89278.1 pantetheine-phosphate adenylyltransferase [Spirochaetota bacterium]HPR48562.1 pantetheine-phosphate adenylyltransferase [Spirochaetota bacterium]
MRIGIYPGSFDPLTNGHLDIIQRAKGLCDTLIVAVAKNSEKRPLFSVSERIEIINRYCRDFGNIEVVSFDGLLVEYCRKKNVSFIIRGLRSTTDFEYEFTIASANSKLAPEIETVFLMTKGENFFISSNIVKEIASYHGDITPLVPQFVVERIQQKYSSM